MIVDNLYTAMCDYGNMDCRLAKALEWLRGNDLKSIAPDQVIVVDGNRVKAQIQAYSTIPAEQGMFETHRSFIDIQIVVEGREIIEWAPLAKLGKVKVPYDFDRDLVFFENPAQSTSVYLEEGDYAVFFPSDGHKPRIMISAPAPVRKIVVKVAV